MAVAWGGGGKGTGPRRGAAWLVAGLAAALLVGLRYAPGARPTAARAAVAATVRGEVGVPAFATALLARIEAALRSGLDGRGWRWPPVHGDVRVDAPAAPAPPFAYPVAGAILLPFGPGVDPLSGREVQMDGLLLGAPAGSPVRAPAAATVRAVRDGPALGAEVVLAIAGRARVEVDLLGVDGVRVRAGESVRRGQVLGRVPAVGPRSVAHLVLEVRVGGIPVDPLSPLFFGAQA